MLMAYGLFTFMSKVFVASLDLWLRPTNLSRLSKLHHLMRWFSKRSAGMVKGKDEHMLNQLIEERYPDLG